MSDLKNKNKNNMNKKFTAQEKVVWKASQKNTGKIKVILPEDYHPTPKPPSRRDLIRAGKRTRRLNP